MAKLQFFNPSESLKNTYKDIDSLFKSKNTINLLKTNLFAVFFIWITIIIFYRFIPPEAPLLYTLPWGFEQIVLRKNLLIIPISITVLFLINTRIAISVFKDYNLLANIILWSQFLINILSVIIIIKLIFLIV